MNKTILSIVSIQELLKAKAENKGLEFIDSVAFFTLKLMRVEMTLLGQLSGRTYTALLAVAGYSYQFYRHDLPQLHEELIQITEESASLHKSKYLQDIETPIISDKAGWVLYLGITIDSLIVRSSSHDNDKG